MKRLYLLVLPLLGLSGCGIQAKVQGLGSEIGPAVMGIDDAIYSVAIAKYKSAQMFKAQIDGNLVLPPLPPPDLTPVGTVTPSPVITLPPTPAPIQPGPPTLTPPPPPPPAPTTGPIVTPNARRR
jgi:hypothetical protein